MALSIVGTTAPAFGTTSVVGTLPTGTALGDLIITSVFCKLDTSIPSAPVGWTLFNTFVGGTGTAGAGVGTVRVSQFYRIAPSSPSAPVITIPTSTGIVTGVTMTTIRSSTSGATFDFEAVGGTDTTSATSFSAVSTRRFELASGDLIVATLGSSADVTMTAGTITSTGSTIGSVVMAAQAGALTGNDLHVGVMTGVVSSGSGDAPITVNATLSAASYGVSGVIRIRENTGLGPEGIHGLAGWWRADSVTATDGAAIATGAAPNGLPARRGPDLIVHNAAAGAQPIYRATGIGGQPAIEFDGTDLLWSGTPGAGVVGAITMEVPGATVFTVSTRTWTTAPVTSGQMNVNNGTTTYNRGRVAPRYVSGAPAVAGRRLDADSLVRVDQGTLPASGTPFIHTGRWDYTNAVAQGFFDGTAAGAAGTFQTAGRSQNTEPLYVSIGGAAASLTTVADLWQGRIAEVLVYNRDLTSDERAQVHTYLSDRYGITVSDYVASASPQTVTGTGLDTGEAVGVATVTATIPAQTLTAAALASSEAVGLGSVAPGLVAVQGAGIASGEALGAGTVLRGAVALTGVGVASAEVFGVGSLTATIPAQTLSGVGLASGEVLGVGAVTSTRALTGVGIGGSEAVGAATVTSTRALTGVGVPSGEALGVAVVTAMRALTGVGVPSAEAVGAGTVFPGAVALTGVGLPSTEAVGTGQVSTGAGSLFGVGIPTAEALGAGTVTTGPRALTGVGIASQGALGAGAIAVAGTVLSGVGVPSGGATGQGSVTAGPVLLAGAGIASGAATGIGDLQSRVTIIGTGIGSTETFGGGAVSVGGLVLAGVAIASGEQLGVAVVLGGVTYSVPITVGFSNSGVSAELSFSLSGSATLAAANATAELANIHGIGG